VATVEQGGSSIITKAVMADARSSKVMKEKMADIRPADIYAVLCSAKHGMTMLLVVGKSREGGHEQWCTGKDVVSTPARQESHQVQPTLD
jgi:hypothetical protein